LRGGAVEHVKRQEVLLELAIQHFCIDGMFAEIATVLSARARHHWHAQVAALVFVAIARRRVARLASPLLTSALLVDERNAICINFPYRVGTRFVLGKAVGTVVDLSQSRHDIWLLL